MRHHFAHVQRPVGVRGIKFRSKAEANYAAYLDWLKSLRQIRDWLYEPHTFWFDPSAVAKGGVRRGVVSYKPDFMVFAAEFNKFGVPTVEWHEVKGYMDVRSRVALARMAKYYPAEKVVVIDSKFMAALKKQVGKVVPGWLP